MREYVDEVEDAGLCFTPSSALHLPETRLLQLEEVLTQHLLALSSSIFTYGPASVRKHKLEDLFKQLPTPWCCFSAPNFNRGKYNRRDAQCAA